MVLAMVRLCMRLMEQQQGRAEPDEEYIYQLFDSMSHVERQPDGDVPVTRWRKHHGEE